MTVLLHSLLIGFLFAVGFYLLFRRNVIRSIMGFAFIGHAVNLFLISAGAYDGVRAAYVQFTERADALPQALVLTAIVIAMGVFAFVLSLLFIIALRYRSADMDKVDRLKY